MVLPIIDTAQDGRVDVQAILAAHGVRYADLATTERLPVPVVSRIIDALETAYEGPLRLRSAERVALGQFGLVDHLLTSAGRLREASELADRFFPLFREGMTAVLREEGERAYRTYVFASGTPPTSIEYAMAISHRTTWALLGSEPPPIEIRFAHRRRNTLEDFTAFFHAPVIFDAERSESVFPRSYLDLPLPCASAVVRDTLSVVATEQESTLTATAFVHRVKFCAMAALEEAGSATLVGVVRAMCIGTRTLQRRLLERGTTFDIVLDDLRSELATGLIANHDLPVARVAQRLGFADAGAFARAFRRWTSMSPSEFRARQRANAG